jgi:NUMOD4 motif
MDEEWKTIDEFPTYQISNFGRVVNQDTGRLIRESITRSNVVKIGLVSGDRQYTRSVKLLVAEHFVDGRSELFDTPIHLDGDPRNNIADNIVWRPRWFAWKYTRQFAEHEPGSERGPIIDLDTNDLYLDMVEAAIRNGLLVHDVWKSIYVKQPTFPTWQNFAFA